MVVRTFVCCFSKPTRNKKKASIRNEAFPLRRSSLMWILRRTTLSRTRRRKKKRKGHFFVLLFLIYVFNLSVLFSSCLQMPSGKIQLKSSVHLFSGVHSLYRKRAARLHLLPLTDNQIKRACKTRNCNWEYSSTKRSVEADATAHKTHCLDHLTILSHCFISSKQLQHK